jgi:hypothetical protein
MQKLSEQYYIVNSGVFSDRNEKQSLSRISE